jgi:hypothetical protein
MSYPLKGLGVGPPSWTSAAASVEPASNRSRTFFSTVVLGLSRGKQMRYNNIVSRLAAAIHAPGTVSLDRRVKGAAGDNAHLRPDIVVHDVEGRRIVIVDVAVPFENGAAACDEAREEKVRKYHSLAKNLRGAGYVVEVAAFLVGALGSWDARNEWAMSLLGVNGYYATWMRRLMVSDCIRWSRNMYVEHITRVHQFRHCEGPPTDGDTHQWLIMCSDTRDTNIM